MPNGNAPRTAACEATKARLRDAMTARVRSTRERRPARRASAMDGRLTGLAREIYQVRLRGNLIAVYLFRGRRTRHKSRTQSWQKSEWQFASRDSLWLQPQSRQ